MNIFVVLLLIGFFAFIALNIGVRPPRPGWGPVGIVLIVAVMAYALWPYVTHALPFLGGK